MSQTTSANDRIHLAISTCPNDTFAFHAILNKKIDLEGLDFQIELLDISQLNDGLFAGKFDVAKASFHAALMLADQTVVLPSGSALGFGVGPLLLAAHDQTNPADVTEACSVTLCPGAHTTATLLMKLFYDDAIREGRTRLEHRIFSDIMPALRTGAADFGVCIHEGRFTWKEQGLHLAEDLGTRWETETDCPLPLGGILARRTLPDEVVSRVQRVVRRSLDYAMLHRTEALQSMRKYAVEFSDDVLFQHVDLYVNDWTLDLGTVGRQALDRLSTLAQERQVLADVAVGRPLEIWRG